MRRRGACVVVMLAAVCGTPLTHGEMPVCDLAAIQREVLTALAREATAEDFAERRRAIEELAALHGRLEAVTRSVTSPGLRALQRRVSGRLVRVGRALAAGVPGSDSARPAPAVGSARGAGGRQAEADKLIDLIQATVRPETWDVNGGRGRLVYFANGHGLVVLAPEDVHDDLGGLIRQLR